MEIFFLALLSSVNSSFKAPITENCFLFVFLQTNSDFDAKPMIMLLGQYSTGKTTFIKHLLKCDYPG